MLHDIFMRNNVSLEYYTKLYKERIDTGGSEWFPFYISSYYDGRTKVEEVCFCEDDGFEDGAIPPNFHRLDGPAVLLYYSVDSENHDKMYLDEVMWYVHDNDITSEIKPWAKENGIDLDNLSDEDVNMIKLVWSTYE